LDYKLLTARLALQQACSQCWDISNDRQYPIFSVRGDWRSCRWGRHSWCRWCGAADLSSSSRVLL